METRIGHLLGVVVALLVPHGAGATAVGPGRPPVVRDLNPGDTVHYFAYGSNMLKDKVRNRSWNGTEIKILTMEPAVVFNHRLAFNMRAFPPLEPAMAGLEPQAGAACEGALIALPVEEYERIWISEGGSMEKPPYKEIEVVVYPLTTSPWAEAGANATANGIKAVTLTVAPYSKTSKDLLPSERYKSLILSGAKELGLSPAYVQQLESLQSARTTGLVKVLARENGVLGMLLFRMKQRWLLAPQRWLLSKLCAGQSRFAALEVLRQTATAVVLVPGAAVGLLLRAGFTLTGKKIPTFGPPSRKSTEAKAKEDPEKKDAKLVSATFVLGSRGPETRRSLRPSHQPAPVQGRGALDLMPSLPVTVLTASLIRRAKWRRQ